METIRQTPADFLRNPSALDRVTWTLTSDGNFSAKSAWEASGHRNPFQPWHSVVWSGQGVPGWSFIEWFATLGRLSKKNRLNNLKHRQRRLKICVPDADSKAMEEW
ncbi:hypothetical protein Vadar_025018 [Vaccinium darrowii]|uniref:Uncharacterized protein n=1 Tax=Vaccinium darrowii TaxID=229202 RepID=A0ACB7YGC2_9ERIC|nr:hypothetical protein Vadar_025018 [Vaccinium darrowii]